MESLEPPQLLNKNLDRHTLRAGSGVECGGGQSKMAAAASAAAVGS